MVIKKFKKITFVFMLMQLFVCTEFYAAETTVGVNPDMKWYEKIVCRLGLSAIDNAAGLLSVARENMVANPCGTVLVITPMFLVGAYTICWIGDRLGRKQKPQTVVVAANTPA